LASSRSRSRSLRLLTTEWVAVALLGLCVAMLDTGFLETLVGRAMAVSVALLLFDAGNEATRRASAFAWGVSTATACLVVVCRGGMASVGAVMGFVLVAGEAWTGRMPTLRRDAASTFLVVVSMTLAEAPILGVLLGAWRWSVGRRAPDDGEGGRVLVTSKAVAIHILSFLIVGSLACHLVGAIGVARRFDTILGFENREVDFGHCWPPPRWTAWETR